MIQITFTTRSGHQLLLDLPCKVADMMQKNVPYFLAYGQAAIHFTTSNCRLNEALDQRIPESIDGGLRELSLLAHLLGRMDAYGLELLANNLPDYPCDCDELLRRASYFGSTTSLPVPLERYGFTQERARLEARLGQAFRSALDKLRMTGGQLFEQVMNRARESGDLARFDNICDYVLPADCDGDKLCRYDFDFLPAISFGGSEGIYIDCMLRGQFDESGRKQLSVGTIKTLETELDACKIMGELCGVLMYHESAFVNENLPLFEPVDSLEQTFAQALTTEQVPSENQPMALQQMC